MMESKQSDPRSEQRALQLEILPWVEKYRPKSLTELISQEEIVNILTNMIETNKLPHLLFHGPPGTGKTSTILACARKMYGAQYSGMVLELNASDDRGIDVVREQIKEFAGTRRLFSSGVKLIILDEADSMTNDAQFALRRVIEKFTRNTRFCMICNYLNKIIPALQSRCTKFRFSPLQSETIRHRLGYIIDSESVVIAEDAIQAIIHQAAGDMRRVINLLQSASMSHSSSSTNNSPITVGEIYQCSGQASPAIISNLLSLLLSSSSMVETVVYVNEVCRKEMGLALVDLVRGISDQVAHNVDFDNVMLANLLAGLADIEHRLVLGCDEEFNVSALVGLFVVCRHKSSL